ncbi:MAG: DUF2065 domain-containing protein [Sinobacteraceae bacterium]|nr:DUF2065 domain-containing protein [Nevskiaceae bacterium]
MNVAWHDFLRAVSLLMVIEGILPFLSPTRARAVFAHLSTRDDRVLRTIGFLSMLGGLLALQLIRWFL